MPLPIAISKNFTYHRVYFVICDLCNENIVERSDERDVDTLDKARQYAAEHYRKEHINAD